MNIQWVLMAEAIAQDGRGGLTAVGVSQMILVAPELPVQVKRAVVALVKGEKGEIVPGDKIAFAISLISPSDDIISKHSAQVDIQTLPWPDLPPSMNLASESVFTVTEYGQHRIQVTVQFDEHPELTAESDFWVMAPPSQEVRVIDH